MRDTVGAQASPLSVSIEGLGNDIFLYWVADCINYEGKGGQFEFVKGEKSPKMHIITYEISEKKCFIALEFTLIIFISIGEAQYLADIC